MTNQQYNGWPLGPVPRKFQRDEIYKLKELGYEWEDARDIVEIFENKVAKFAGAKYGVAVDSCSNGIFLCLKYLQSIGECPQQITVPSKTYVSVPQQIVNAGLDLKIEKEKWEGIYQLKPSRVWDGAIRWREGMYVGGDALQVVSFQMKKRIPIGRGGMILTNSEEARSWFKIASHDGRDLSLPYDHPAHFKMIGWHMYMTPEDAARGIIIMDQIPSFNADSGDENNYVDLLVTDLYQKYGSIS